MSIESVMLSDHLILCRPLLFLPSVLFPTIRVFPNESALCIRWPKYWSFSFSISPSNEYSRLVSFIIDWFDLLAIQGLSRLFSSTTVRKYQFFGVQPSLWSNSHIHRWLSTQNENISFILLVIPSWPLPPKLITFLVMVSATQANHFFSYCFPRTWELNPPFYLYHFFWGKHPYGSVRVSLKNRKRLNVPFADVAHFLVLWFDGTWCGLI